MKIYIYARVCTRTEVTEVILFLSVCVAETLDSSCLPENKLIVA